MPTQIKLKSGSGAPTSGQLVAAEPAFDLTNKRLYTEDSGGNVIEVGTNPTSITTGTIDATTITADGLTANGDVLLGTDTDTARGSGFTRVLTKMGSGQSYFEIQSNNTTDENAVLFSDGSTGNYGALGYNHTNDALVGYTASTKRFEVGSGGDLSLYEDTGTTAKFFWDASAESLGIGTSSPVAIGGYSSLTMNNTTGTFAEFQEAGTNRLRIGGDSGSAFINGSSGTLRMLTSDVERMRIDSSGNLSLNSNGSIAALDGVFGLQIGNTSTSTAGIALENSSQGYLNYVTGTDLIWWDSTNNAERMKLNSSGNVGIGTTPDSWASSVRALDVGLTASFGGYSSGGDWAYVASNFYFDGTAKYKTTDPATIYEQINGSHIWSGAASGTADTAITWSERMRIDSSGNLLVGTNVADGIKGLSVKPSTYATSLVFNAAATANYLMYFRYYGTNVGTIYTTNTSTSYNTSSDYRLKEDVQDMIGATDRVMALKPCNFAWKSTGERVDGFLAHEAQAVVPEAVHGVKDGMRTEEYEISPAVEATYDEEGNELTPYVPAVMGTREVPDYQGIDQSKLVPLLTKALQEALERIAVLEAKVG